jgi:uncharacterized membrane protein
MAPQLDASTVGPVDVAVFSFPGNQFNGEVAPALIELAQNGTVRIIDLALVTKDADGNTATVEITGPALSALEVLTDDQFDLLNDEDLDAFAEALEPNSSALVVVWDNQWAAKFAAAVRASQGELIFFERIPRENVEIAIEALNAALNEGQEV